MVAACDTEDDVTRSEPVRFTQYLDDAPSASINVEVRGSTVTFDARQSRPSIYDEADITKYSWTPGGRRVAGQEQGALNTEDGQAFESAKGERLSLQVPTRDGEYFVSLEITDAEDRTDTSITYFVVEQGRARAGDLMHEHPAWVDDAVVYAPIPALWGKGGTKAVQRRLPYLKELGVDALWLWPPTSRRAAGEEYAITDYFEVDPSWGPEDALKEMVDEAHRLGMHVLVDFVPNHLAAAGPYFKDAEARGKLSPYWNFFDRTNGEPTHYFDWSHLPNLNFDDAEVRRMVIEASVHWVRDIGVDGFRMDVAWGVKRRRPDFWPEWRRELKRINPDVLLLAEASAVDPYYFSNGFDVAYDWTNELGQWAWSDAFEFPQEAGALLEPAITNGGRGYSEDALILRFVNNNDTGTRFVDLYGPRLTKVAVTQQFTLPGVPAVFAGDEIGASYEPYSNLTRVPWRDRYELMPLYKRLIELKHVVPALGSRDVDILESNSNGTLAYLRPGDDPALVVLNYGGERRVRITSTPDVESLLTSSGGALRDVLNGGRIDLSSSGGAVRISMGATSSAVLMGEGRCKSAC